MEPKRDDRSRIVYTTLREWLSVGKLHPGQHLAPEQLGRELSVSVTPIREALIRLEMEALVEFSRNRGFFVATLSELELRHLYEFAHGALHHTIKRMPQNAQTVAIVQGSTFFNKDPDDQIEATHLVESFYHEIARLSGNAETRRIIDNFCTRTRIFRRNAFDDPSMREATLAAIRDIAPRIENQELDWALLALDSHFERKVREVKRLWRSGYRRFLYELDT
ncbi:GntR family transcriptional regulator [Agrobacterium fabrum]|uniref:GntR family transcriptional regulator n=1 Tax=Agrobacterium fabrum TaxID=1176649 RepID=UPI003B9F7C3A